MITVKVLWILSQIWIVIGYVIVYRKYKVAYAVRLHFFLFNLSFLPNSENVINSSAL